MFGYGSLIKANNEGFLPSSSKAAKLWYLDLGALMIHKDVNCAKATAEKAGVKDPLYTTIAANTPAGWRYCKCVYS